MVQRQEAPSLRQERTTTSLRKLPLWNNERSQRASRIHTANWYVSQRAIQLSVDPAFTRAVSAYKGRYREGIARREADGDIATCVRARGKISGEETSGGGSLGGLEG